MGQVIPFERPPTYEEIAVWQCDCGCQTFILCVDGRVICSECEQTQDHIMTWEPDA